MKSLFVGLLAWVTVAGAQPLVVPAFTAYIHPDPEGLNISSREGVRDWKATNQCVIWFGQFTNTGSLKASVECRLPTGLETRLRLKVGEQASEVSVKGGAPGVVVADFGEFQIREKGFTRFTLELLATPQEGSVGIRALALEGPAVTGAHFNLKPRRNAASVHLAYPVPAVTNLDQFYCEVTAIEEPVYTFYMACGWNRGYFGMQINSPTERRIIFSVWDSGNEAVDRNRVRAEDQVTLIGKGDGVYSGDFGNEGTGGHSHLKYLWKTGERQRFWLKAEVPDATHTIYSGYWFHPEKKEWMLISSWKAPKAGTYLRGLHSFSENFGGDNGHLRRKALYGNQWYHTVDGPWQEILVASFSHDATGREDRRDRFMGVEAGQFFLSHGGFVPGYSAFGEKFTRPASGAQPSDLIFHTK
jgi:hypothetical protein